MDEELYLSASQVIRLTGLKKSQVYNLIKQRKIIAISEVVGTQTRHKVRLDSMLLWLAVKNDKHQKQADKFKQGYELIKRCVNNG